MKDTYIFVVDYTPSPKSKQFVELDDKAHKNLEDRHPNAYSFKKYVKEIKGNVER